MTTLKPTANIIPLPQSIRRDDQPKRISTTMIATHLPEEAPALDLLMIPGGGGNRGNETDWIIDFVKSRFDSIDYIASVCTGSLLLAKSSILDNRRATTNKAAWNNIVGHGPNVNWVPNARWTQDGNIWTSSGVAAGMDMTYALLSWIYGSQKINETMNSIELSPHTNPDWDPYAVVHNVSEVHLIFNENINPNRFPVLIKAGHSRTSLGPWVSTKIQLHIARLAGKLRSLQMSWTRCLT